MIIRSEDGTTGKTVSFNGESFVLERLEWKGWAMERRWCLEGYLIASSGSEWSFLDLNSNHTVEFQIGTVPVAGRKFLNSFLQFRKYTIERQMKEHLLVELYLVYNNYLEVWLLNLTNL